MANSGSKYQVFLNFCGMDTGRGFTDTLYNALKGARIPVFIDKEEIEPGEEFGKKLVEAIDNSKLYITIFSPNYASKYWCLHELAKMVENAFGPEEDENEKVESTSKPEEDGNKKVIFPIFYNVKTDDLKSNTGLYSKAISEWEQEMVNQKRKVSTEEVEKWRRALQKVGGIQGWELDKYRGDGHLSKSVVEEVVNRLQTRQRKVTEDLVGMEDRIAAINNLLGINSEGVRLIGICGMGGIGKTTLAKKIFNQLCPHFGTNCSFLDDVREMAKTKGLVKLQKQLLSNISNSRGDRKIVNSDDGIKAIEETICNKRVLIVLDDVDDGDQIRKLIGTKFLYPGTRILVTTRDNGVFNIRGFKYGFEHYEPEGLSDEHALQLFYRHAFDGDDSSLVDYHTLSEDIVSLLEDIVSTAAGLPLALQAIGSSLFGVKNIKIWKERLEKLRKTPHKDVLGKLRISYDALEPDQQQIFLDVSCFFIGENKSNPMYMWEDLRFGPEDAIDCLRKRCMIKVLDGDRFSIRDRFWIHDQFRDLGRAIAKEQRTRLWDRDDIIRELRSAEIKRSVQALCLQAEYENRITVTAKEMEQFPNLQFLSLSNVICQGNFTDCLSKLKWIRLIYRNVENRYDPQYQPRRDPQFIPTNLHLENVVVMDIWGNEWTDDAVSSLITGATKLKVLTLDDAHSLRKTPTFPEHSVLKKLTVSFCCRIDKIDCSIMKLTLLEELTLNRLYLQTLKQLPSNLRVLKLENSQVKEAELDGFPQLEKLTIEWCALTRLSIKSSSRKLTEVNVDSCPELVEVQFFGFLQSVEILDIRQCRSLERFVCLPEEAGCNELQAPELTHGQRRVSIVSSSLKMLQKLVLRSCPELHEIQFVSALESLKVFDVLECISLKRIDGLSNLKNLNVLGFQDCESLQVLEGINELERLRELQFYRCRSMGKIIDASSSKIPNECFTQIKDCGELLDTGPYASSITWDSYKEKILNAATQVSDAGPSEQQDDGDKDDDNQAGSIEDEDDKDNNVHEVLQSTREPPPVSSVGDNDENNDVTEEDKGKGDGDEDRDGDEDKIRTRKRGMMKKLKRRGFCSCLGPPCVYSMDNDRQRRGRGRK